MKQTKGPMIFNIPDLNSDMDFSHKVEAWTSELRLKIQTQKNMAVQVIILVLPAQSLSFSLKEHLRHFLLTNLPVPFVFVSGKKLQDSLQKSGRHHLSESFLMLTNQVLYRALLKSGSVSFIPQKVPIIDLTPTMVVGIVLKGKQFAIVASLKKELDCFYSNSAQIKKGLLD